MTPLASAELFQAYPPDERPVAPPTPLGGAGGLSGSSLWRYQSAHGGRVVRLWPTATAGIGRVTRIHGWLGELADLPFISRPIRRVDGGTATFLSGRCWEIDPWLPGRPATDDPPTTARVRRVFQALAEVHVRLAGVEAEMLPSPGLLARRDELRKLRYQGFEAIERGLAQSPGDPLVEPAREWLASARSSAPDVLARVDRACLARLPLQPCLRDARPGHFLFEGGKLSGLIDFGAMDVESVAADLARLLGEWLPLDEATDLRAEGLAAYRELRPTSTEEDEAAVAFEQAADVLIAERWVRWRFQEHRRFEESAFADGLERGLTRIRRLARRLGSRAGG